MLQIKIYRESDKEKTKELNGLEFSIMIKPDLKRNILKIIELYEIKNELDPEKYIIEMEIHQS